MVVVILVLVAVAVFVARYGADTTEAAEWRWSARPDQPGRERHAHTPARDAAHLVRALLPPARKHARPAAHTATASGRRHA